MNSANYVRTWAKECKAQRHYKQHTNIAITCVVCVEYISMSYYLICPLVTVEHVCVCVCAFDAYALPHHIA